MTQREKMYQASTSQMIQIMVNSINLWLILCFVIGFLDYKIENITKTIL